MSQVVGFSKMQKFDPMDIGFQVNKENHELHYIVWYQKYFYLFKGIYYKGKQGESPETNMKLYIKTSSVRDLLV